MRQLLQLVGDQSTSPEALLRSKRGRSKGDVGGGVTSRGAMEMGRSVGFIEGKEVQRDYPIKYFLPMWVRSTVKVPEETMEILVSQNEEISGGGKKEEGEGVSSVCQRRANRGSISIKKRERG